MKGAVRMVILEEEFSQKDILSWLEIKLKQYHKEKYGESSKTIYKKHKNNRK